MGFGSWLSGVGDAISSSANWVNKYTSPLPQNTDYNPLEWNPSKRYQLQKDQGGQVELNAAAQAANVGVEKVGEATSWLRKTVVSHPLSTALLMGKLGRSSDNDFWGFGSGYFSAANWSSAWRAAANISPGQAFELNKSQAEQAIASPLQYYKPAAADLPEGFNDLSDEQQQAALKEAGMPVVGNQYIEELRKGSKFYKYSTGVGDFALSWWADPTIVAGKLAGEVRAAKLIKARPAEGWAKADIDKLLGESSMVKAQKYIWDNKDNPQLLNNLKLAQDSAMGPRFGHIASKLQTPEEVNLFLRVGMGDLDAADQLVGRNIQVEGRLAQMNDRLGALDLMHTRYAHMPAMQRMVDQQIEALTARINADDAMKLRYNDILDHSNEIDRLNLSRWSFTRAEGLTEAQNAYRGGAAYGYKTERPGTITPSAPPLFKASALKPATPIDGGMIKQRIWGAGDFFSMPVTLVRSLKEMTPNGWMRIDDITKDSVAELRAQVARIPNITPDARMNMINGYLKTTTEGERMAYLDEVEQMAASKIAEKHGLTPEAGQEIYKAQQAKKLGEKENAKAYSAAMKPGSSRDLRVDEFEASGGRVVLHPHSVTRLANSHVFQPLDELDKVLARHSSALRAIRESRLGNSDWIVDGSEFLTSLFKTSVLFRLGYIPRVLGDDISGQWAAAGSAAMAARFGWGVRNGATNAARALAHPWQAAKEQAQRAGVEYANNEIDRLAKQIKPLKAYTEGMARSNARDVVIAQNRVDAALEKLRAIPRDATPAQRAARQQHFDNRALQLQQARMRLAAGPSKGKLLAQRRMQKQMDFLVTYRDLAQRKADDLAKWRTVERQGDSPIMVDGKLLPSAFSGTQGEFYKAQISADESVGNIFASNKQLLHGNLMRSFDHGGRVIRVSEDADLHAQSWAHAITTQIMQDPLEAMAVKGANVPTMKSWLSRTAEGHEYQRRIGLKFVNAEELAQSAKHEVDEYLPTPEIRRAALEGRLTPQFLKDAVPREIDRPEVHTGMIGVQGQGGFKQGLDRVQQKWFNVAATIPANRMSRHPLFNQLYEGHAKIIARQMNKQGGWTVSDVDQMTTAARRLALRDTRKLVFDIAHRSDAAAALRFISPFFGATAEAFQRWGRIIADKPQTVGYAADFFNAPIAAGMMQDSDGNSIMRGGYRMVKDANGKWKKESVPKSDRWIVGRMPTWVASSPLGVAMGVEQSSGKFALSQNSMNLVTQGDPWFNPGVGPVVQIPVNEFVKDKPKDAEIARKLGVLPFGPQSEGGLPTRAGSFVLSAPIKNFLTAYDTSDERYQAVKMQIMQRAIYEHDNMGKPMPTAQKIADMTKDYWLFSAASAFSQPMATKRQDAYQFYRDQYNELRRQNPQTADQEFLDHFGESYFIFAQAQSKNVTGIQATEKAYELSKEYAGLISEHPELGALIVGPEGNGPFSPEVYSYQLNTPVTPGGSEMQRSKMSAEEAMKENQRRLGWSNYTAQMNKIQAQLHAAGFNSFSDKGAERLALAKRAVSMLYGDPLLPDGSTNPYYNEEWSKDFYTFDVRKNDRMAAALTTLADSPLADDPRRGDLRKLREYLDGRKAIISLLAARKAAGGAGTLTAQANADLATAWGRYTDSLTESNTDFADLYNRYLSRDLNMGED
jgi:hypothetical protein